MRWATLFFLVALTVVPSTASARSERAPIRVGVVANTQATTGSQNRQRLDEVKATGARWAREEFRWDVIQPRRGRWNFARYDALVLNAARKQLRILPLLLSPPRWSGPTGALPRNPRRFSRYVARVVARYGPKGSLWRKHRTLSRYAPDAFELWNEPYFVQSSSSGYNPRRYARLVKASVIAGRKANERAKFLLAAENTGRETGAGYLSWIGELYKVEPKLNRYYDAVAVHPYGNDVDGLTRAVSYRQLRRIEQLRQEFIGHGARSKPFWITEVGWSTCTKHSRCVGEREQASLMREGLRRISSRYSSFVKAVFLFHAHDYGGDPRRFDQHYGLARRDGSRKPAFSVFRRWALER